MGQQTDKSPVAEGGSKTDHLFVVMQTIGDTTWRMFVPAVGFTLLGVWLDKIWGTKPWLMIAGIVIGCVGAFLLVSKQIKSLKRVKK